MTFIEKTELLIKQRGAIKAAIVEDIALKVNYVLNEERKFWEGVEEIPTPASATIWFMSGSYAAWDRFGKYWDFIVVPEIPAELKK